jgi:hypothetical protein
MKAYVLFLAACALCGAGCASSALQKSGSAPRSELVSVRQVPDKEGGAWLSVGDCVREAKRYVAKTYPGVDVDRLDVTSWVGIRRGALIIRIGLVGEIGQDTYDVRIDDTGRVLACFRGTAVD